MTSKIEGNPPPIPSEYVEQYKKSIEDATKRVAKIEDLEKDTPVRIKPDADADSLEEGWYYQGVKLDAKGICEGVFLSRYTEEELKDKDKSGEKGALILVNEADFIDWNKDLFKEKPKKTEVGLEKENFFQQILEKIPESKRDRFRSKINKDFIRKKALERLVGEEGLLVGTKGEMIDRLIGSLVGAGAKKSLDMVLDKKNIELDDFTKKGLEFLVVSLGGTIGKKSSQELREYIIDKLKSKNTEGGGNDNREGGEDEEDTSITTGGRNTEGGGNEGTKNKPETESKPDSVLSFTEMHEDYVKRGLIKKSNESSTGYIFTEDASSVDRELIIYKYIEDLRKKGEEKNKDEIEKWEARLTDNTKTIKEIIDDWVKYRREQGEETGVINFGFSEEELEQKPKKLVEIRKIFEDQIKGLNKKIQTGEPDYLWQIMSFIEAEMKDSGSEAPPKEESVEIVPPLPGNGTESEPLITEEDIAHLRKNYREILHQRNRKFFTWLKSKLLRSYREGYYSEESLNKARADYEENLAKYRQQEIKKYTAGIKVDGYTVRDAEGNVLGVVGQDEKTFNDILAERIAQIDFLLMIKEKDEVSKEDALIVSGDLGYKFGKLFKQHPVIRAAIGFGLTGIAFTSFATGVLPLAGVALGLRAGWAGISAAAGTEGLLQFAGEKVSRWRGNMKKLSPDELKNISEQDLAFRLCAFQENQAKKGETLDSLTPKELEKYNTLEQAIKEKRKEELRSRLTEYRKDNPDATLEDIKAFLAEDYLRDQISEETAVHERMIARRKRFAIAKWTTAIAAGAVATTIAILKFSGGKPKGVEDKTNLDHKTTTPEIPPPARNPLTENYTGYVTPRSGMLGGSSTDTIDQALNQYLSASGQKISMYTGQYSWLRDQVDSYLSGQGLNLRTLPNGYPITYNGRFIQNLIDQVLSRPDLVSYPHARLAVDLVDPNFISLH